MHRNQPVCEMTILAPLALLLPLLPAPFLEDFARRTHSPPGPMPAVVVRKSIEEYKVSAIKQSMP